MTRLLKDLKKNRTKYLLIIPIIIYIFIFCYKPMYGLIIAFKDYIPAKGIADSEWVGFRNFTTFFKDHYFWRILRNTFSLSSVTILFGFPAPIIFALLLNEIKNKKFKRVVQTISYMPYFISMVVVCGLIRVFTQSDGLLSHFITAFGGTPTNLLSNKEYFYPIYVISEIWQTIGWDSIIYLAALTGISPELYEAARVDGAGRFRQMISITIPGLMPTISVLFILRMGGILNVGFEKVLLLYSPSTYEVADIISTYVYRIGVLDANYSYSTATGMFNSVVFVLFLGITTHLSHKVNENSLF